jgi:hypothetical protein
MARIEGTHMTLHEQTLNHLRSITAQWQQYPVEKLDADEARLCLADLPTQLELKLDALRVDCTDAELDEITAATRLYESAVRSRLAEIEGTTN